MRTTVAGTDDLEHQVLEIWSEVLGRDDLTAESNFFEHGDSLAAYAMISTCEFRFNVELDFSTLMEYPVLRQFAQEVLQAT